MRSPTVIGLLVGAVLVALPAAVPGAPPAPPAAHGPRTVAGHPITPFSVPR